MSKRKPNGQLNLIAKPPRRRRADELPADYTLDVGLQAAISASASDSELLLWLARRGLDEPEVKS